MQGRIFVMPNMRTRPIVIRRIGGKNSPQVRFAEDDHLIQALATQCTDIRSAIVMSALPLSQ
jgi:hypothetical protein